jgi:hypothetical protein
VIEALAVSLMTSNKANVAKAARHTEAIAAYLYGEHQIRKLAKKPESPTRHQEGEHRMTKHISRALQPTVMLAALSPR